jgi:hypothetical protein
MIKMKQAYIFIVAFFFVLLTFFTNCSPAGFPQDSSSKRINGTDTGNPYRTEGVAALPKTFLLSDFPSLPNNHNVLLVGSNKTYSNCQTAIDAAQPGDEVVIDAGFVCQPIALRDKGTSEQYIVIRSSNSALLPPQGTRLSRANAADLAIIETSADAYAITFEENAHHYHLAGLEVRVNASFNGVLRGLISIGPWNLTPLESVPHHIVIARSWIHADSHHEILEAVRLNGSSISLVDSIIDEIHAHSEAAVAIAGWKMGAGPFKIVNNEIVSAGESLMLGGYVTAQNQIPSDVEFRRNYVHRPLEWRQSITSLANQTGPWRVGPLISFSNAQRILVYGNVFENRWSNGGSDYGYAAEFAPDALSGSSIQPWTRVQDIVFAFNIVRNAAGAFNIVYQNFETPEAIAQRLEFSHNLVYGIDSSWGTSLGVILLRQQAQGPTIFNHNTILSDPASGPMLLNPWSNGLYSQFTFTNNICADQGDGIKDSNHDTGSATLSAMFPGLVFGTNVLAGQNPADYQDHSSTSFFPANLSAIGFTADPTTGVTDYHGLILAPSSPYRLRASDGTDIGADVSKIESALNL